MVSVDQERAILVFEQALECLEVLFAAVGARELSLIRRLGTLLASGEKIDPREMGLGSRAALGDLILSAENGHKVTKAQQVWANACLDCATGIAGAAASFLWIYDRLTVKEEFAIGHRGEPEIRVVSCARCGDSWVERKEIERVAAAVWAHLRVRPLIEAGQGKEAADEALSCTSSSIYIKAVERILRQRGVKLVAELEEGCHSCGFGGVKYDLLKIDWEVVRQAVQSSVV